MALPVSRPNDFTLTAVQQSRTKSNVISPRSLVGYRDLDRAPHNGDALNLKPQQADSGKCPKSFQAEALDLSLLSRVS